jgi:16S rRNA (adenine1518-N6/adenine1519-N6)-dimethyltransferase
MYQINALNPKDEGHQARKRFGQNFLHDQRVIAKIVRSVNPRTGDNIVEIGPGLAALTSPLIGECDALTVVELDRDLAAGLPNRVPHPERLTIIEADALKFDFSQLFQEGRPLRVVGTCRITFRRLCYFISWSLATKSKTCILCCKRSG